MNMFYEFSTVIPKSDAPSDFCNIAIRNISGSSDKIGIQIKGLPEHKLKNIRLENILLTAKNAFVCSDVEKIDLKNIEICTVK